MEPIKISSALSNKLYLMGLVCAVLVVFNHTWVTAKTGSADWWASELFFNNGVCKMAVPYFFAMSGFLFANRGVGWARKKISSLLVPYEIWNILSWIFALLLFCFADRLGYTTHTNSPPSVLSLSAWVNALGFNPFCHSANHSLWYVRNLMIMMALVPFWDAVLKKKRLCFALIVVWTVGLLVMEWKLNLDSDFGFFFLHTFALQGVFFLVGMFLRFYPIAVTRRWGILAVLIGAISLIARCLTIEKAPCISNVMRWSGLMCVLVGVWSLLPIVSIPMWAKRLSFPIYVSHIMYLQLSAGVIGALHIRDVVLGSVMFSLIRALFGVFIISVMVCITYNTMPRFAKIIFGGR